MTDLIALRYPIGNFEYGKKYTITDTRKHIKEIAELPKNLKKLIKKFGIKNASVVHLHPL